MSISPALPPINPTTTKRPRGLRNGEIALEIGRSDEILYHVHALPVRQPHDFIGEVGFLIVYALRASEAFCSVQFFLRIRR